MDTKRTAMWIAGMMATVVSAFAGTPAMEISRFTIDCAGAMDSTGGGLELSGTIGQADAGVLEGGGLTLSGGFWFGQNPCDCNQDGGINLFDYSDFEACLFGPEGGVVDPACMCFDLDADGDVDLADLGEFQRSFSGF